MIATPASVGKTAYRLILGAFFIGLLIWVAFSYFSSKYWREKAQEERAGRERAEANHEQAMKNARNADFGAQNSTQTRAATDELVIDLRGLAELGAGRIESRVPPVSERDEALDPDIIAEIEAAEKRVKAQSSRLRGSK